MSETYATAGEQSDEQAGTEQAGVALRPLVLERPRVVIVGGGFGGLRAARALRRSPVAVTVIDRMNHHVFQPLLYWVATAGLSPADISGPIRGILSSQRNAEVQLGAVTGVDVAGRRVLVRDPAGDSPDGRAGERAVPYDYLILATGTWHSYFGHDDWERAAPGLKSLADATALRRRILLAFEEAELERDPDQRAALLTFVVVGGGPTGVEMAGAIAELARHALVRDFRHINTASSRVLLVEAGPRLLPTFSEKLASRARRKLEQGGVEVRLNQAVDGVDAGGVSIAGERVAARTVAWAAGVRASPAGNWIGAKTDRVGRVLVNPDLSVPDHPEIFVIGDTASLAQDGAPLPGVAQVAMQAGTYAGTLIRRRVAGEKTPLPPFHYRNKGDLATVGRSYAIARIAGVEISGLLAWLVWVAVHIFYLIGFRHRMQVMMQWAWNYLTYQRGARLIVPSADDT
ncbi:MAG TPA: NAD(P)/FAD-dependent oxidoreductase [Ktedonobacterales bacterium]|jgi:NADH dehydrogenase